MYSGNTGLILTITNFPSGLTTIWPGINFVTMVAFHMIRSREPSVDHTIYHHPGVYKILWLVSTVARQVYYTLLGAIRSSFRERIAKMSIKQLFSENIRQFMAELFVQNEKLATEKNKLPLTDEQLEAIVRRCFSNNKAVMASLDNLSSSCKSRIRVWRSEYNRGLWPLKQEVFSFRYGETGEPINRHGHPLSEEEVLRLSRKKHDASSRTESNTGCSS